MNIAGDQLWYIKAENVQPDWNDSCLEAVRGPEKAEEGTGYPERTGRDPLVMIDSRLAFF